MGKKPTYEELEQRIEELEKETSELKRAEEALLRSEKRYRTVLDSIGEAYFEVDLSGNFTFYNDSLCRMLGYRREELLGMNNRDYMAPGSHKEIYEFFNQIYRTGKPGKKAVYEIMGKDGSRGFHELSASLIRDQAGQPIGFRGIARDITEFIKLQSQLQQARKMEAIATLAGGIAHQFNNALTPIIGNIGLLEMDYRENEELMRYLKDMKSAGRRMADLTSQLLAYARGGKYSAVILSLGDVVQQTLPLMEHTLNPGVRVETDFPQEVWDVKADSTQMQMVVSAIIANANEAIDGPGRIRISAANVELDPAFTVNYPGIETGPYVRLCIEDNGRGMNEETRNRIFEPFFTTHFMGRGLGMPAAYGIVANHKGIITVDSALGKGTQVCVYIPAA